jgi:PilZ domain-containing protein
MPPESWQGAMSTLGSLETTIRDPGLTRLRSGPRVDLFREIACESGGTVVRSQVADLSVGGMFVETTPTPLLVGTRVVVRFSLQPEDPLALEAEVGYVEESIGIGLRFQDLTEPDRKKIAAFVEEALHQKRRGGPPLRSSARVTVELPIHIRGADAQGDVFDEATRIITLSKHGACLVSVRSHQLFGERTQLTPAAAALRPARQRRYR